MPALMEWCFRTSILDGQEPLLLRCLAPTSTKFGQTFTETSVTLTLELLRRSLECPVS